MITDSFFFFPAPVLSNSMFLLHDIACVGFKRKPEGSGGCLNLVTDAVCIGKWWLLFRSGIHVWQWSPSQACTHLSCWDALSLLLFWTCWTQCCKFALWVIILTVLYNDLEAGSIPLEESSQYSNSSTLKKKKMQITVEKTQATRKTN